MLSGQAQMSKHWGSHRLWGVREPCDPRHLKNGVKSSALARALVTITDPPGACSCPGLNLKEQNFPGRTVKLKFPPLRKKKLLPPFFFR